MKKQGSEGRLVQARSAALSAKAQLTTVLGLVTIIDGLLEETGSVSLAIAVKALRSIANAHSADPRSKGTALAALERMGVARKM